MAASADTLLEQAVAEFRRAAALVPDNMAVTMRLGALLERRDEYVDALTRYLRFANQWGRVFEVRYRLAATLAMSDTWLGSIGAADESERAALAKLLRDRGRSDAATAVDAADWRELHASLLAAATAEWRELLDFLSIRQSLRRFSRTIVSNQPEFNDANYQWRFLRIGAERRTRLREVKVAAKVAEIQALAPWPQPLGAVDTQKVSALRAEIERLLGRKASTLCHYNAACCYGRLYLVTGDTDDCQAAIRCLRKVVSGGSADQWITIMRNDPDLAAMRRTQCFYDWWEELGQAQDKPAHERWAGDLARAMERHWETFSRFETTPTAEAAHADDELLRTLHRWMDEGAGGNALAENAAALHVRVEPPPARPAVTRKATKRGGRPKVDQARKELTAAARRDRWQSIRQAPEPVRPRRQQP